MFVAEHGVGGRFAAITLLAIGAFSAGPGCLQANNCPKDGVMKCDKGMLFACEQGDFGPLIWHELGTCVDDPLCPASGTNSRCDGDDVISCAGGWRTGSARCGGDDNMSPGPAATHCVTDGAFVACVPPESMPDPACGSGQVCSAGTTLIYCIGGLAVSRIACLTCADANPCRGFMGDTCNAAADCVAGLTCRPDSKGVTRCTAPCDPAGPPPPGGPATASQSCVDLFRDGGPAAFGYYLRVFPSGTVVACVAGFCEWAD